MNSVIEGFLAGGLGAVLCFLIKLLFDYVVECAGRGLKKLFGSKHKSKEEESGRCE